MTLDPVQRRELITNRLLGIAEFSHAHWFFGNVYEALVKIPHRVAGSGDNA